MVDGWSDLSDPSDLSDLSDSSDQPSTIPKSYRLFFFFGFRGICWNSESLFAGTLALKAESDIPVNNAQSMRPALQS